MNIEIMQASHDQKPVLEYLLELYIYDFTEFLDFDVGPDGSYGYDRLPLYWKDSNRYPFLIFVENKIAGFAFVQRGCPVSDDKDVWDIAEFFILRKYRRKTVGTVAAINLWGRFKGRWQVRVLPGNKQALSFWSRAINQFVGIIVPAKEVEINKELRFVFYFDSV
jgi:predicted acetyltransferase